MVEPDHSAGPSVTAGFSWKQLLVGNARGVLLDIVGKSQEAGEELFFTVAPKIVSSSEVTLEFRTAVGQMGRDRSRALTFSVEDGNLSTSYLESDYTDEVNASYSAGKGLGALRQVEQAYDTSRMNQSVWGRCEGFKDARNQDGSAVQDMADQLVSEGRPRIRFGGTINNTRSSEFGRDWDVGDRVRARHGNFELETVILSATIRLTGGVESVQARMEYEGWL